MSDINDSTWSLALTHGKQTFAVAFKPEHPQRIALLKREVERLTGIAAKHQRLIYRGKELRDDDADSSKKPSKAAANAPALVANAKVMLLFNQMYHQDAAQRAIASPSPAVAGTATSSDTQAPAPAPIATSTAAAIEIDSLDADEVLVHAFRGKANYEFVLKRDAAVLAIKQRLCAILGLSSAQGIRLVVKGKTPADATVLSELLGTSSNSNTRPLKCMVLLQAQQHEVLEKEDELRQLLNELTQLTVDARRVAKQVARNFASREETMLRVTALVDSAERVHGNLTLLFAHLCPMGGTAKPHASPETAAVLTQAIDDAAALRTSCQALLQRVTLL